MPVPVLSRRVTAGHGLPTLCAIATGLLLLGGCAVFEPPPKPSHPVAHAPPKPHVAPSTTPTGSAAAAGALHPQPSTPASSEPAGVSAPIRVVGWSQEAVRRLLGPPAEQNARGAGQTWRYQGRDCQVEIAFYYDVTRGDFFALSQHPSEGSDAANCLARVHPAHDP
jgi:hypothetical protein